MSKRLGGIIGLCRCRCCLLFISHYKLIRYECSCGHKIDGIKPNQTGKNTIGEKKKQEISADGNHTYINININININNSGIQCSVVYFKEKSEHT